MAISKDEIDKYIFDPDNPRQCKSYGALLNIAKKENTQTFISPDYFKYLVSDKLLTAEFNNHIWDMPSNYNQLEVFKKVELFIEQNSLDDLDDFYDNIDIDFEGFKKRYKIFKSLIQINNRILEINNKYIHKYYLNTVNQYNKTILVDRDTTINKLSKYNVDIPDKNSNFIFFSRNIINILYFEVNKLSIMITGKDKIDEFLKHSQTKIKPIFLKRAEDLDLLLNILEQDLKKEKSKNITQEEISTIEKIHIKNFYSIKAIKLNNLKDKKEIYIVGENGDGKSLLLQAITIALVGVKEGDVFDLVKEQTNSILSVIDSDKKEYTKESKNPYSNILTYGASRNNYCKMKEDDTGYLTLFTNDYDLKSPVKWLQYLDYNEQSGKNNLISVTEAKKILQHLLNSDVEISISPNKVIFAEKGSEVSFDQLSAGYKGVITIACDLIARLSEKQSVEDIAEFQGIVLIDEIELHLHPKWKYNFMKKLRDTFPLIQFIVTTHSPTVILGASREAVFYKIYKDDGEVKISNQIANRGYTNNTLISSPLFDLDTMTSPHYDNRKLTEDDFIYEKIHEVVSKKIKEDINLNEDAILELIEKEFAKHEKN